eukprot:3330405-Amphidinium_carterae.1
MRGLSFPHKDDTSGAGGTQGTLDLQEEDPPVEEHLIPRPSDPANPEQDDGPADENEIPEPQMARKTKQGSKPE